MKPHSTKAVSGFLRKVAATCALECDCEVCRQHMGEYVEQQLAGRSPTGVLEQVAHHLGICDECREESEVLLLVLRENDGEVR